MMRGATLFSGGGGVESLLKQRINFVHAVEYDPAIAAVYRQNHGDHIQVADVCDVDYATWGALDYLHASPVCKNASQAKTGGEESNIDIQTARAVVRCLEATQPRVFTLENVWGYRQFQAFRLICQALDRGGYMWHFEHLNAADFGVPQTRRRLILRAVKDALLPGWPEPEKWVGWYAAIEDLLADMPESQFAAWQLARLPEYLGETAMMWNMDQTMRDLTLRTASQPVPTVDTGMMRRPSSIPQAFIVAGNGNQLGMPDGGSVTNRDAAAPYFTITAACDKVPSRAWLIESKNANQQYGDGMRRDDEPATTVITDHKPSHQPKAWLAQGRVVRMTPRALARFQSLPDSYVLPEKSSLACTVIGNMVPSLMMQKIVEPLL